MTNVPEIRFKGFADAWEQRKLGEIAELSSSKRIHVNDYVSDGIPFYRGSEISTGGVSKDNELYISDDLYSEIKQKYGVPSEGDLLITAVGTLGNIWKVDNRQFYYKDGNLIRLSNLKLEADYLVAYLADGHGKKKVLDSAAGSNQKALTMIKLNEISIFAPNAAEQTAIGNFFRILDNAITLHKRKLDGLKELKKGYLQLMFPQTGERVPRVRFAGFTGEWEERKLGEVAEHFEYGLNASAKEFDGVHKYIRITDIDEDLRRFNESNLTSPDIDFPSADNYLLRRGDILFARTGASVGKTYIHREDESAVYFAGFLIRARFIREHSPEFIYQNTLTEKYNTFINIMSQRSGQPGVNAQEYAGYSLGLPSESEQTSIGNFFRSLDEQIATQSKKLRQLKQLKAAYLQKMFV